MDATQVTNLWPSDLHLEAVRTPVAILREQASLLARMTQGLVLAEVKSGTNNGVLSHTFRLVVPAMSDYRFDLFRVLHDATIYPVEIPGDMFGKATSCANESEFQAALRSIFSSEGTRKILQSLVSQAKDTAVP